MPCCCMIDWGKSLEICVDKRRIVANVQEIMIVKHAVIHFSQPLCMIWLNCKARWPHSCMISRGKSPEICVDKRRRSPERAVEDSIVFKNSPSGGFFAREKWLTMGAEADMPHQFPQGWPYPTTTGQARRSRKGRRAENLGYRPKSPWSPGFRRLLLPQQCWNLSWGQQKAASRVAERMGLI